MKHGHRLVKALLFTTIFAAFCFASPPGGRHIRLPKANGEAEEKLKAAYAAFEQGQYQKAINLAYSVWQKYGDVQACWYPKWVLRFVRKEHLPDPYDRMAVVSETIRSSFLYTKARRSAFPSYLLAKAYAKLGNYERMMEWVRRLGEIGYDEYQVMLLLPRKEAHKMLPPKNTWRPLPLRFREEDYFVLVPLDEACKVLGLSFRYKVNQKTGKKTGAQIGEKGLISLMGRPFARNIKGEVD
ncbi:MAG: hypothetical protein ACK40X_12500, partial [Armatimonadota bacterium]